MTDILADWDTLLRQASMTADTYMGEAIDCIDKKFGDGFAEKNPDLVVGFMKVAASDFWGATLKLAAQDLRNGLLEVAEQLTRGKKP
jgi:hypothetical protein